ncbi:unnamed protein product [Candidula unifasciata]|uniref:Cyclin N-terminal domain-containing protein 1 n=1 Tax=Candidula unifasciata TaxID=100452 RepID=A0A8S3ZM57_9EUPU|nr:unnamed protein product [Candidula unifasciata]
MPVNKTSCQQEGIFGTPSEPLFNNDGNGASAEVLQDWLVNMAVTNSQNITAASVTQNIFIQGSWSECVFLMCDRFELPCQAKFAALDIFDRFMLKHILDLYAHVQNSKSNSKRTDWECILGRVKNQAFLRILSCCQIASKLNSHYEVITVKRARRCLLDAGYSYSCESILQSEMRVLKTLAFKVSRTSSLDFIEILLEILGHNTRGEDLHIKVYHNTAVKILTLISLHLHEVYDRLYLSTAGAGAGALISTEEQRSKLAAVMMDKMLLAVAVVATAVHVVDSTLTQKVIIHLHKISEVPIEDIQDFMKVILVFLREISAIQNKTR